MKINYWDCKYSDAEEHSVCDDEGNYDNWFEYRCSHPDRCSGPCSVDNKWGGEEAECSFAEIEQPLELVVLRGDHGK